MRKKDPYILLGHGSGGKLTHQLIGDLFLKHFGTGPGHIPTDSAMIKTGDSILSFTTDSFVIDPVFFPGGDIGKLAIAGTVNDLAVSGAVPMYISVAFILEEGFATDDLETIVKSMAREAEKAGVRIVTGDTKVVNRGKVDKIFITTTGIGILPQENQVIGRAERMKPGDRIILSGTLGDHGMAIIQAREQMGIRSGAVSDCTSLNHMIRRCLDGSQGIRFMRDPTRGGLATVLAELASFSNFGIEIYEEKVPVRDEVAGICEMLGFDPLYVANEGKVVMVVDPGEVRKILEILRSDPAGQNACDIGVIVGDHPGKAWLHTRVGGKRIIDMLSGEQLPRIC